jgi:hypothetical protein
LATEPPATKLDALTRVWNSVLPHRTFDITDASIRVVPPPNPPGTGGDDPYSPRALSDGERVIFYLIGQCLLAPENGFIIVDEPELHIHPSITSALWDALERERTDCAFIYLTHDLEFATNRVTAKKYFLRAIHYNSFYDIEEIPENTGLSEQVVLELAGNRKPVLFVEGDAGSLDMLLYRSVYSDTKIEAVGSCDNVIHSVSSFRKNPTMHRWGLVFECIDADQRSADQISSLVTAKIFLLPVAEIENLFLLPTVFLAFAKALSIPENEAVQKFENVTTSVFSIATAQIEPTTARYVSRQIDRRLKIVTVDRSNITNLAADFSTQISAIDILALISDFQARFTAAITSKNIKLVLEMFDQKGLLNVAGRALGPTTAKALVQQASRFMADDKHIEFRTAVLGVLPRLN